MWKPVIQNVKGYATGGKVLESFNQIPSGAPELLTSAGAQRESPAEYLQSRAESFNAEQNWRQGHQLTGMQKERVAEEAGQLKDAGKYLGMDVGLGTRPPYQDSGPGGAPAPAPPLEDQPYSMGFQQRQQRPTGSLLGTSSLLGLQRGGTIDYRNGGTVAGGPPGVDTVPVVARPGGPVKALLNNGEYALPTGTVAAVGKPALDQLVIATTGQKPVGYGIGGLIDKLRGRDKQIDEAVDKAVAPPPPPEEPKGQSLADIMKEIRKKNPPVGQRPQGYAQGGMTELERKRMQAIDPRYAVAVGERPDVVRGAPVVMLEPKYGVPNRAPVMLDPRAAVAVDSRQQWQDPIGGSVLPMSGGNLIDAPTQQPNPSYAARPVMRAAPIPAESRTPFADAAASAVRGMSLTADGTPTGNPDVGAPMPMNLEGLRRDMQSSWRGQVFTSDGNPTPVPDAGAPVIGQSVASSIVPDLKEQAGRRAADVLRYVGAATRGSTPDTVAPVTGQSVGDSILPDIARHGAKALSNTRLALQGGAEDAEAAWNRGDWAGAGGHLLRGAAATMLGAGMDAANLGAAALQPLWQAGKTAFTGESTPSRDMTGPGLFGSDVAPTVAAVAPPSAAAQAQPVVTSAAPQEAGMFQTPKSARGDVGKVVLSNQTPEQDIQTLGIWQQPSLPPGAPTAGQLKRSSLGLTSDAFNPTGAGFLGTVGGAPAGVSDADYAKMSLAEKSAAKVKSINEATAAIRDARNARREAEGSPRVGESRQGVGGLAGLAGLKPSEQIAYLNLMRGLGNDQRLATQDAIQNQFDLADLKIKGAGERRAQTKAQREAQENFIKDSDPFAQKLVTNFPWMQEDAGTYLQQASTVGAKTPAEAVGRLAATFGFLEKDDEPRFTLKDKGVPGGSKITGAQAVKILNRENIFDRLYGAIGPGNAFYEAARRQLAREVQAMALQGYAK